MTKKSVIAAVIVIFSTAAFAHDGVKNPAVKARMDAMAAISANLKTIGAMAQGQIAFDPAQAETAIDAVANHAADMPDLFLAPETDPKSEALPVIWTNWDDFIAQADKLRIAAEGTDPTAAAGLAAGLQAMGGTCRACHRSYRM